jgi:transposase
MQDAIQHPRSEHGIAGERFIPAAECQVRGKDHRSLLVTPCHQLEEQVRLLAAERIAEALYIDADTVREYRRLYKSSGVTGLERLASVGAEPDLTTEQRATLAAELAARRYMTSKEVCAFVAAKFGVEYTLNAMSKLLNGWGSSTRSPSGFRRRRTRRHSNSS